MGRVVSPGRDAGFTLMETVVALGVLTFGLLSIGQVLAFGLGALTASGPDMLARQKAAEAVESVYTARDTRTVAWDGILNVQGETGADGGVFLDGLQPLTTPGSDGLVNTANDGAVEAVMLPGADGLLGTADDVASLLDGFQREIEILSVNASLRRIVVRISYQAGQATRQYVIETFISAFA